MPSIRIGPSPSRHASRDSMPDLIRKNTDMCYHIRDLRRRNDLLQQRLDEANARIAALQRVSMQ